MFKRKSEDRQVRLPEERKALAERYTIDADEAEARARLAEAQARREAEAQARREAEEQARRAEAEARRQAEEQARREAEEQVRRDAEAPARREQTRRRLRKVHVRGEAESPARNGAEPAARVDVPNPDELASDLPVFGWLQSVKPAPPGEDGDWTRELVREKEAPSDEARRT